LHFAISASLIMPGPGSLSVIYSTPFSAS
jgi:hypothetical protein